MIIYITTNNTKRTKEKKKLLIATKYRKEEKYNKLCKIHMESDNILLKDVKEEF